MTGQITLSQLNAASCEQFESLLADIFEHSSWIPERASDCRPFESLGKLHSSLVEVVEMASTEEQLGLLRAHPELAGKAAQQGELTELSSGEQQQVGMNALSEAELIEVGQLNAQYREKFGFPFIIAVLDNSKEDIFRKWRQRINNDLVTETSACLDQVYLIAKLRLTALTGESFN